MAINYTVHVIRNYNGGVVSIHEDAWRAEEANENCTDTYIVEHEIDLDDLLKSSIVQKILKEILL